MSNRKQLICHEKSFVAKTDAGNLGTNMQRHYKTKKMSYSVNKP